MEDLVNAVLMAIQDGGILQIADVVKMTLEECMKTAAEVNASDTPFILLCSPIIDTSLAL